MARSDDTPAKPRPGKQDPQPPERERREYPHGSGDRNSWSPTGEDRMPIHEGGTQRDAPAEPGRRDD